MEGRLSFSMLQSLSDRRTSSGLERALESMRNDWEGIAFAVVPYKETGTYVVGGIDEIQALLDDQAVRVAAVRSSPFVGHVATAAEKWAGFVETLQVPVHTALFAMK